MIRKVLIFLTVCLSLTCFAQHSKDNCTKCNCTKWHRTITVDTLTKEKTVFLSKEKGNACRYNGASCRKKLVEGRCEYRYITSYYHSNGKLRRKITSKGWASALGGKNKTTEIIYNAEGKKIDKKVDKNVLPLYKKWQQ